MVKKSNNKGFTFIELLVYMAILSVFMVAVCTLIGSTITSYKKINSRKKLQTQATETYDSIADMLMSASDVKIQGDAYVYYTQSGVEKLKKATDTFFVVPTETETINDDSYVMTSTNWFRSERVVKYPSGESIIGQSGVYPFSKMVKFEDSTTPSTDEKTMIDPKYVYIKYSSGIDASGNNIYSYCTLKYDEDENKIYIVRVADTDSDAALAQTGRLLDSNGSADSVLCKNVANFQMQVNPETGTFAIILELEDTKTATTYDLKSVVNLRNSYVLSGHEW